MYLPSLSAGLADAE
jgi:hypothetical protein